ncbi:phytoene dehydrogenase-like protein [Paenibacillus rhizosphaerae]|uniref:Phytoene dehydrogenase-like protein n=1 Tax=Paenibacillus rhizosphaerae TaxID=297318 RepID=A0A839TPD1_9BACL|nr:FAD-dependent oxidoreductase [Paenibacillus rhizosphaerae]MBB3128562.1 phytoene dehydrogenase-like protein [Paenibacillus rhizosphaerae]
MKTFDAAIIGGGISGLVAAIDLARGGKSVVLFEKAGQLGGRAISVKKNGAIFDMGSHAIIKGGALYEIFQDLGIRMEGGSPGTNVSFLWNNKVTHMFKFILSRNLSWSGKMEFIKFFKILTRFDADSVPAISLRSWAEQEFNDPMTRHIIYAMLRTNSYAAAIDHQMAGPALRSVARTTKKNSIVYIQDGWITLVDQLYEKAVRSGVTIITGKNVTEIKHDGAVRQLKFADGQEMDITHVIAATPPEVTFKLLSDGGSRSITNWKEQARVTKAATLTLSLKHLPAPDHFAVLGLDQPVYFINQSKFTRLSEDGTSVVNLTKSNGTGVADPKADERFLEQMLDLIQPGWRKEVVARQYLPNITVAYDFMHLGREDRFPGPDVPEIAGLYVAGEWATHGENLADAAAASGRRAARRAITDIEAVRKSGQKTLLL